MNLRTLFLAAGISLMCLAAATAPGAIIFTNLISFTGTGGAYPGAAPFCGLTLGADGNFYGTTSAGGTNNLGTVFRLTSDGSLQTLVTFNGTNGATPYGALTLGGDGLLYGTTFAANVVGGVTNYGTIFRLTAKGELVNLFSFTNLAQGANPGSALVSDGSGNLYGVAEFGGTTNKLYLNSGYLLGTGYGTIFEWTTNGTLNVPFVFGGTNGACPSGGLLLGKDGNFYGTTRFGGTGLSTFAPGFGTIFRFGADGSFTNLHLFSGGSDGGYAYAGLAQGSDGYLYSVTFNGGTYNAGTLFKISTNGYVPPPSPVHTFSTSDGGSPYAGMVEGSDGNLYGTTYGVFDNGSVVRLKPDGTYANLYFFGGGNIHPAGVFLQGPDNNFYGTTVYGGANNSGTIFRLSIPLPPVIETIAPSNGSATLSWSAVVGQSNEVLYATDLALGNWTNLTDPFVVTNGVMSLSDPNAATSPQRFYRVLLLP